MNATAFYNSVYQGDVTNTSPCDDNITSISNRVKRTRVQMPNSSWIEKLQGRFDELCSLIDGWDGYNGIAVHFNHAHFAAHLIENLYTPDLEAPNLVPGSDGTLQIEWHMNQYDIEIDVLAPYNLHAVRYDHLTNTEEEIALQTDFTTLTQWMKDLKADRQNHKNTMA